MNKLRLSMVIFIFASTILVLYPTLSNDYGDREIVESIIRQQEKLQVDISKKLQNCSNILNCYSGVGKQKFEKYDRSVSAQGEISLLIHESNTRILLTPSFSSGAIAWICSTNKPLSVPQNVGEFIYLQRKLESGLSLLHSAKIA